MSTTLREAFRLQRFSSSRGPRPTAHTRRNTWGSRGTEENGTCVQQGMSGDEYRALLGDAVVLRDGRYASSLTDLTGADPSRRSPLIRCRG